jgi:hypothetical protein
MLSVKNDLILSKKLFFACMILSFIAMYFTFAPAINIPFYNHDAYKFSAGGMYTSCQLEVGYNFMFDLARPFTAFLDCANFKFANTLARMADIRIFAVLLLTLTTGIVSFWLCGIGFPLLAAFLIGTGIFLLPALQTAMIMGALFLILTPLAAFLAALSINTGFLLIAKHSYTLKLSGLILSLLGIALLFTALFTYPAVSGFYLFPATVLLFFKPLAGWSQTRKRIIRDVIILLVCNLIFFFIAKHVLLLRRGSAVIHGYTYDIAFQPFVRLRTLFDLFANLWLGDKWVGFFQAAIVYFTIITGTIIALLQFCQSDIYKNNKRNAVVILLQAVFLAGILLAVSNSAYFGQPMILVFTRIIFSFQVMALLFIIWSLYKISSLFKFKREKMLISMLVILPLVGAIQTNYIMTKSALSSNMELNFISANIAGKLLKDNKLSRVHVIVADDNTKGFIGLPPSEDIFMINSTVFAGDMRFIINSALLQFVDRNSFTIRDCAYERPESNNPKQEVIDCIKSAPQGSVVVSESKSGEDIFPSPNMVIIDMNHLSRLTDLPLVKLNV